MKIKKILFFLFSIFFVHLMINAQKLAIYTEEFAPYNFTENGKITGASTEIMEAVLKLAGYEYTITSLPWARAMETTANETNSFIYSISRQEKREKLYKWVGVIAPVKYAVYALKNREDIKISKLEDMKKYMIGTTISDSREAYLLTKGFEEKNFDRTSGDDSYERNFAKLLKKRIDLWPMSKAVMYYLVKNQGYNPDETLKTVYELNEISGSYYLATNLNTSDAIVEKMRAAIIQFKQSSEYLQILKKWGL